MAFGNVIDPFFLLTCGDLKIIIYYKNMTLTALNISSSRIKDQLFCDTTTVEIWTEKGGA